MLMGFDLELPGQRGQHGRGRLEALVAHGVGSTLTRGWGGGSEPLPPR